MKSVKKIAEYLNIDIEAAKKIRGLIEGSIDPETFESVSTWIRQCYNEPSRVEKTLTALNEILEGSGVEGASEEGRYNESLYEYVNMGDTYAATIAYYDGDYLFTTWGSCSRNWNAKVSQ